MMSIIDRAKDTGAQVDSFAYFGEKDLYGTWGFARIGTLTREETPLETSNHHTIWNDLSGRFCDDVALERMSHWAVGWVDQILVRVYTDSGEITDAFRAVCDWEDKLADYPVADEEDYSERELVNLEETLSNVYDIPDDYMDDVMMALEILLSDELIQRDVDDAYSAVAEERAYAELANPNQNILFPEQS